MTQSPSSGVKSKIKVSSQSNGTGLRAEVEQLGPWFHNLHLPDGTQTAPHHPLGDFPAFKWDAIAPHLPENLRGWSVLDIGCNAGFYSFELARRGGQVLGIDVNAHYLEQARWAAKQKGVQDQVQFRQMQVYDLAGEDQQFDLILFLGVFYHLRYPMLGLDIVTQKAKKLLLFQTLMMPGNEVYEATYGLKLNDRAAMNEPGWPKLAFLEHHFAGDPTNWWAANHAGIEAMLRSCGMTIVKQPIEEFYLCAPDPEHPSCMTTWNQGEFLSATGRSGQ